MKTLCRLFLVLSLSLVGLARAQADQVLVNDDLVSLQCNDAAECVKLCGANICPIAKLTCNACARQTDPGVLAIFRSLGSIFETTNKVVTKASFAQWLKGRNILAVPVGSPLNPYADPFEPAETEHLQASFDQVCHANGRHMVLAEISDAGLRAQAMICETQNGQWIIQALHYRADYLRAGVASPLNDSLSDSSVITASAAPAPVPAPAVRLRRLP